MVVVVEGAVVVVVPAAVVSGADVGLVFRGVDVDVAVELDDVTGARVTGADIDVVVPRMVVVVVVGSLGVIVGGVRGDVVSATKDGPQAAANKAAPESKAKRRNRRPRLIPERLPGQSSVQVRGIHRVGPLQGVG